MPHTRGCQPRATCRAIAQSQPSPPIARGQERCSSHSSPETSPSDCQHASGYGVPMVPRPVVSRIGSVQAARRCCPSCRSRGVVGLRARGHRPVRLTLWSFEYASGDRSRDSVRSIRSAGPLPRGRPGGPPSGSPSNRTITTVCVPTIGCKSGLPQSPPIGSDSPPKSAPALGCRALPPTSGGTPHHGPFDQALPLPLARHPGIRVVAGTDNVIRNGQQKPPASTLAIARRGVL